ncbi:hypothetical protein AGMMS49992_05050 [Clostridia bacterium]|nr:hypothetical protein AGMMS49992_05050 [Clostridia bacterium]
MRSGICTTLSIVDRLGCGESYAPEELDVPPELYPDPLAELYAGRGADFGARLLDEV